MMRKQTDFTDWERGWELHHSTRMNWGSILVGLAILLIGVYWFGKELGWWAFSIPVCPLIMVMIGGVILMGAILKKLR